MIYTGFEIHSDEELLNTVEQSMLPSAVLEMTYRYHAALTVLNGLESRTKSGYVAMSDLSAMACDYEDMVIELEDHKDHIEDLKNENKELRKDLASLQSKIETIETIATAAI